MGKVGIYLNFQGNCEEAFNYYKSVFKTEFSAPIFRMGDMKMPPGAPTIPEKEKPLVMHVALPLMDNIQIMGSDMLESMGHKLKIGNNTTISLEFDSKADADRVYAALSKDGSESVAPHDEFWGYWGVCLDKFGIRWMFNCPAANPQP
jgi:PhnB protein